MAFISYEQKEDFQDDTFKMVAALVVEAVRAQASKDEIGLFESVDCIYTLLHKRVNSKDFDNRVVSIRKKIYSAYRKRDDLESSVLFDEVRALWKELAGVLDDAGLLLRERVDKAHVVAQR